AWNWAARPALPEVGPSSPAATLGGHRGIPRPRMGKVRVETAGAETVGRDRSRSRASRWCSSPTRARLPRRFETHGETGPDRQTRAPERSPEYASRAAI